MKERDELRQRLDDLTLEVESKHPATLVDVLEEGKTTVHEVEMAKLRRGWHICGASGVV